MAGFDPDKFLDEVGKPKGGAFDPDQFLSDVGATTKQDDSNGNPLLKGIQKVGEFVDSYTGAPVRASIGALQDGKNPVAAYTQQFGGNPQKAPTGKQIAEKAGISDEALGSFTGQEAIDAFRKYGGAAGMGLSGAMSMMPDALKERTYSPSKSDVAGLAIDIAADPLNIVPVVEGIKNIPKVAEAANRVSKVVSPVVQKGTELAADAARSIPGARAAETMGTITKQSTKNTLEAVKKMFAPRQAEDYKELLDIAKKNGIEPALLPESVEFGEGSMISRAARNRAEGPYGERFLKKFEEGSLAVQDATERKISQIGGGQALSPIEAGEIIREGYDQGVDNLFNSLGMTYNKVQEAIPGLQLSPEAVASIESKLNGLEKWAKGRSMRGFTQAQKSQGDQLLSAIEAVRSGKTSYKQALETLRDVGEVAFKTKNILADIPPDVEKFRDLYGVLRDGLIDTTRQAAGDAVADELIKSNEILTNFFDKKSTIANVIGNKNLAPEKVFSALIDHGDSTKINALREILPPEQFKKLKGAFLNAQIRRSPDDSFTFKSLQNNLRNKRSVVASLLDADEINQISDLIRLGDRFGNPVLSSSGTGASSLFSDFSKGVRSGIENDAVVETLKKSARERSAKAIETPKDLKSVSQGAGKQAPQGSSKLSDPDFTTTVVGAKALSVKNPESKNSEPKKGPVRWVNDGVRNLQQDSSVKFADLNIEKIKESKRGLDLLYQASSLKPGSPAMKKVIEQLRLISSGGK